MGYLASDEAVGYFAVPAKVVYALQQIIPAAFAAVIFPAFSYYHLKDKTQLAKTFNKAFNYLTIVSLPIAFGLIITLPQIINQSLKPQAQVESQATLTKIIKRDDGLLNWQKTALEISRQFRAFYPWPGVYTQWQGRRLKIANLSVSEADFKVNLATILGRSRQRLF